MHLAWAQSGMKYVVLTILGGFLCGHISTANAQTQIQDTIWYTPTAPYTNGTSSSTVPVHLAYTMPVTVHNVLIAQVSNSNINYSHFWYGNTWFNQLDIYIAGVSNNNFPGFRVGIVITIDDIRNSERILFKQLDIQELSMTTYPNPTSGKVTLEIQGNESQPMTLKVLDLQGRCVLTETIKPVNEFLKKSISLEPLSPGSYFLQLQGSSQIIRPIHVIR